MPYLERPDYDERERHAAVSGPEYAEFVRGSSELEPVIKLYYKIKCFLIYCFKFIINKNGAVKFVENVEERRQGGTNSRVGTG